MPSGWILNFDLYLQGEGETEQVCGEKLLGTRRASQQIWQTPATEIREVSWRAAGRRRQISRRPPVISPAPSATESAIVRVYNSYADVLLDANNLWMSDIGICQKKNGQYSWTIYLYRYIWRNSLLHHLPRRKKCLSTLRPNVSKTKVKFWYKNISFSLAHTQTTFLSPQVFLD